MNTEKRHIIVSGLSVEIVRKNIKNLHLGVYPPAGRVRVAAPFVLSDEAIRMAVIGKLGWIKRQRARFIKQPRQSAREYVSGESHYFLGRRYRLRVYQQAGKAKAALHSSTVIELYIRPGTDNEQRARVMREWYRHNMRDLVTPLLDGWQQRLGVQVSNWGIKRMKTKWGSCNADAGRVWLNLELMKKPVRCVEYVVVHELIHLRERHHSDHFTALMDKYLPDWQSRRQELNSEPLAHEHWTY